MSRLSNLGIFGKKKNSACEARCAEFVANNGYVFVDGERRFIKSQRELCRTFKYSRTTADRYCTQFRNTLKLMEAAAKVEALTTAAPIEVAPQPAPATTATIAPSPITAHAPASSSPMQFAETDEFDVEPTPALKANEPTAQSLAAAWTIAQARANKPTYDNSRGRRPNIVVVPNSLRSL